MARKTEFIEDGRAPVKSYQAWARAKEEKAGCFSLGKNKLLRGNMKEGNLSSCTASEAR
jgi:hypothetical protein